MKTAAPHQKHLSKRFRITLIISSAISILFLLSLFIPHDYVFPLELRNSILEKFTGVTFCIFNLFVCISCIMIMVMRYDSEWISGAAMLFFPFLLVPILLLLLLSLILPASGWRDDKIYKSGSEYLILEINPGREMDLTRTVVTHWPYSTIRPIRQIKDLTDDKNGISDDTMLYENKIWLKEKH
jgi:hypothetical protein